MVNAIIADDNKDLCITLANELNLTKEIKVIEIISDGAKVIQEIKKLKPQIIILDMKMPGRNGLQIIEDMKCNNLLSTKVIVFSGEERYVSKVINDDAVASFIPKSAGFKETTLRIRKIAKEIGKKNINQLILDYLLDLGFTTSNRGTFLLRDCIRIFLLRRKEECKVKELFKIVADINSVAGYIVKNNIHKSAKTAWNLGDKNHRIDKLKLGLTEEISPKRVITMAQYYIDID